MRGGRNNILLVDDDVELCDMLKQYLEVEAYRVDMAHNGNDALQLARIGQYDIMVLDVMMPGLDGFEVLRELRRDSMLPVLMLTARGEDVDSIIGLELGADDYLSKPCNPRVLMARIRAILRRSQAKDSVDCILDEPDVIRLGDLVIETGSRRVLVKGQPEALTSTEYSVLEVLARQAGHVVSKEDISRQALDRELTRYDRSIDMHVSNLRKKLGPTADGDERIMTVRGIGYQYVFS